MEMVDVVIEVMVEARNNISDGEPNPFRGQSGEILPSNLERSFSGFFSKKRCH